MKRHLFSVLLIAAVTSALYANTLNNGFVYDDEYTIENNTLIKSFDNLPLLFNKSAYFSRSEEMSYRPVVTFSYLVDYALYGLTPWGYHMTNLLLHAANGALLYIFLTLILTPYSLPLMPRSPLLASPALLASLLFVSHPVLTEAVNCISYREDLLAFLFYITTLSLYLVLRAKPTTDHRPLSTVLFYLLSCLSFLLALLSKEMAVTLPLIILWYEGLYGEGKEGLISRLFSRYIIGYLTITLFYLYLRFYLFHNPEEQIQAWSLTERFLTLPWFVIGYLKLSLFPVHLSADYLIKPVTSVLSPSFIWPFISLISILVIPFTLKEKKVLFGALFFLIALLPVYNIIPISNPLAERYLYLPMAGFVIVIGMIINANGSQDRKRLFISLLLILCVFAFSVVKRNTVWRDNYSLWTDTLNTTPDSSRAHNSLGTVYDNLGRTEEAILEYKKALRLEPNYAKIYYNLGNAYWHLGRMEDAVSEYGKALSLKPNYTEAHINLGNTYWHLGRMEDAVSEYEKALRFKPDYPDIYFNLGMAYKNKGLRDEARRAFENALRINPIDAEARQELESLNEIERKTKNP